MTDPDITTARTPIRSASHPIMMPPRPDPRYASDPAMAGAERAVSSSEAIGFNATTATSGAP